MKALRTIVAAVFLASMAAPARPACRVAMVVCKVKTAKGAKATVKSEHLMRPKKAVASVLNNLSKLPACKLFQHPRIFDNDADAERVFDKRRKMIEGAILGWMKGGSAIVRWSCFPTSRQDDI